MSSEPIGRKHSMRRIVLTALLALCLTTADMRTVLASKPAPTGYRATPVITWSHEARRAIVPPGPNGVFGAENYGNKFPGEAAIYLGIVHAAIYDAAVAIQGGYRPYAIAIKAPPGTSADAAIATAVHHVLI